jgi:hypothetical protein
MTLGTCARRRPNPEVNVPNVKDAQKIPIARALGLAGSIPELEFMGWLISGLHGLYV